MSDAAASTNSKDRPLAVLFGGNGFLGRRTAHFLNLAGWRVRVASRHPNPKLFPEGNGLAECVDVETKNPKSVADVIRGASAVVNLIGILFESKRQSFDQAHRLNSETIAKAAVEVGVKNFVQISSIGASAEAASKYSKSKAAGENAVLSVFPDAVILRPSIIFGSDDTFFNRFAQMARFSPALPLVGAGKTLFEPVFVDDVARAVVTALEGRAVKGAIYELGGPDRRSFTQLLEFVCTSLHIRRLLIPLSFGQAHVVATGTEVANKVLFGRLPEPMMLTRDQVETLKTDNVVSSNARASNRTLAGLGIDAQSFVEIVPAYLQANRGQKT